MSRFFALLCLAITSCAVGISDAHAQPRIANNLVPPNSEWAYYASAAPPPADWLKPSFDDRTWQSGIAGFGYDDDDDRTVLSDMRGRFSAVHIRRAFTVHDPDREGNLILRMNYDDGFAAYLNGRLVAKSENVSITDNGTPQVTGEHEAGGEPTLFLIPMESLREGSNLLAIVGLNYRIRSSDFTLDPSLVLEAPPTLDQYLADISTFEDLLLTHSSYLNKNSVDWTETFENLRARVRDAPNHVTFSRELTKALMQMGDCHAGVTPFKPMYPDEYLPFRIADTSLGLVALDPHEQKPLDEDYRYLTAIDSVPIETCLAAAATYAPAGSPQHVRTRSLSLMRSLFLLRQELSLPQSPTVRLSLQSKDQNLQKTIELEVTDQRPTTPVVKLELARELSNNIGYIRIGKMQISLIDEIIDQIKALRSTDGLIIDVRYNPGGQQHVLRAIYPFFIPGNAAPHISNIAAYRLADSFKEDHIGYRGTHRASWESWTPAERSSIARAEQSFQPEWTPKESEFSEWHYLSLCRTDGRRARNLPDDAPDDYFHYDKPIVVLSNPYSFSATDGFLGAFADLPQVTIIGEPSGGGSGSARRYTLPNTRTGIRLSSMASFRANGKSFDGNGIEVDILAKPTLADFLDHDQDSVLERGIEEILNKRSSDETPDQR